MKYKKRILFITLIFSLLALNHFLANKNDFELTDMPEFTHKNQINSQKLFDETWLTIQKDYYDANMNNQTWYRWKTHYQGQIKTDEDAKLAINTMLASLNDPYSRFMSKKEFNNQNNSINSKITGIGVTISSSSGKIKVINVIENTPAQSANLLPNDIIFSIDDTEVNGLSISEVGELVQGEINTPVKIVVIRNNDKITKKIIRKEIKIKSVKSNIEDNIGYIQISSFIGATTPNEFVEALEKTKDTEGLILDLRGNTGGLLPNAIFIANLFIPEGNIVSIVGRNGYKYDILAQNTEFGIEKPTVVLVDHASASASEILSGALKDYKKATLLGTTTYGKGMVQKIIPMPNNTGLNLTIAKYLTPNGNDINKKGITPDVQIDFTLNDIKKHNDAQLQAAKNILSKMISQN
ncbi:MAG: S41 family peptidase [Candidatus Gastranaerophilales bacterium]